MCPLLSNNREKRGLALDGKLKNEDTNLASSTIIVDPTQKENLGIIVQYRVRVRLVLGFGASDVSVELPFTLAHPKPPPEEEEDEPDEGSQHRAAVEEVVLATGSPTNGDSVLTSANDPHDKNGPRVSGGDFISLAEPPPSQSNVVLEDRPSDDLIFEDFARLRLRGQDSIAGTGDESIASTSFPVSTTLSAITPTTGSSHLPTSTVNTTTNTLPC
ncbi:unnamed protein product [Mesocestoides corti]|uniref:Arrestin_C domain-containing protein n=1 Tax=Mesocestoides corti TaxID=53468 RepID=A0A0R3UJI8_MESCO|nr:unnamed protein product [Mesocestoides corti]